MKYCVAIAPVVAVSDAGTTAILTVSSLDAWLQIETISVVVAVAVTSAVVA